MPTKAKTQIMSDPPRALPFFAVFSVLETVFNRVIVVLLERLMERVYADAMGACIAASDVCGYGIGAPMHPKRRLMYHTQGIDVMLSDTI
ncbi:hypothetical protein CQ018_07930 [Arthrobacter sp. MYb227]|nr:hypothetical protein CQ018_07930 [Arthrobacter sp. MYb227]